MQVHQRQRLNSLSSPGTALRFAVDTLLSPDMAPDIKMQVLCNAMDRQEATCKNHL